MLNDAAELRAALRAGTLERWRLELAAHCGHEGATRVASAEPPPSDPARWFARLAALGEDACVAAHAARLALGVRFAAPHAWAEPRPDGVVLAFFAAPGPALAAMRDALTADTDDGPRPTGYQARFGGDPCLVAWIHRPAACQDVPGWSRPEINRGMGLTPDELRPHLQARLIEWALRPLAGPSRAPLDLDVLVAPRAWWEGPPPW